MGKIKMVKTQIFPAGVKYMGDLAKQVNEVKQLGVDTSYLEVDIAAISHILEGIRINCSILEHAMYYAISSDKDIYEVACLWRDQVKHAMIDLRYSVDLLEENMGEDYWPIPTYIDLMYGV